MPTSSLRFVSACRTSLLWASCVCLASMTRAEAADVQTPQSAVTFEQHVRPILKAFCLDCHGGGEQLEGKLDLRLKRFMLTGGESGTALRIDQPAESLLIKRLKSGEMPPTEKKVPAEQIAVIERWIAGGAATLRDEPESLPPGLGITAEERAYWFFQPLRRPNIPLVKQPVRARSPVDHFVLAKLDERGTVSNDEADRFTLLKRAAFDLMGLPPTPDEVDQFLSDSAPDAFEKRIDRLLASPHYGERWGRHWLDVAGYADSEGDGSVDTIRPYIYKFRDYVVRSLNADKPLDQFITEQLAGDELVAPPYKNLTPEQTELLVATGFLRMAADPTASGQGDPDTSRNQVVADTIKIVSSSLLGLSVGCAQCHDHRYDPIPQADYFQLRAIFQPALDPKGWVIPRERVISLYTDEDRARAVVIEADAAKLQADVNTKRQKFIDTAFDLEIEKHPAEQRDALRAAFKTPADKQTEDQKKLVAITPSLNINGGNLYQYNASAAEELKKDETGVASKRGEKKVEDFISVLKESGGMPNPTHLFHRGDHRAPMQVLLPADLTIAAPDGQRFQIEAKHAAMPTSGRRLAWAKHITNGSHPLVGRVLANRIWLHHFGRGIVDTPGEFGILGTRPTHPELLDWLAVELVGRALLPVPSANTTHDSVTLEDQTGKSARPTQSLKRLHRLLMSSAVYRQSSRRAADAAMKDADGAYYSRFPVRRLEAEIVRDRALAVSSRLNDTLFGSPIEVVEDFAGQVHVKDDSPRRSLYIQSRRTKPVSLLAAFDAPVMTLNCDRRPSSTVAPQSLMLMNGDFILAQAEHLSQQVYAEGTSAGLMASSSNGLAFDIAPFVNRFAGQRAAWQYGYGGINDAPATTATTENPAAAPRAVVEFHSLPHWTGSAWQGAATLPDAALGYALSHAGGGHPGGSPKLASIKRWTAPREGFITVSGQLQHGSENGDGVRSRVVSSRSGLVGEWTAKNGSIETPVARVEVREGDTLDFITDAITNENSDSFNWPIQLRLFDTSGTELNTWNSQANFHGPLPSSIAHRIARAWQLAYGRPITAEELQLACQFIEDQSRTLRATAPSDDHERLAFTNLCQQLLSSNEFLYVD